MAKPEPITIPLTVERRVVEVDPLEAARGVVVGLALGAALWTIGATAGAVIAKAARR